MTNTCEVSVTGHISVSEPGSSFDPRPRCAQEGSIWGAGVGMSFDGTYIYAITANNDASGESPSLRAELSGLACSTRTTAHGHFITKLQP